MFQFVFEFGHRTLQKGRWRTEPYEVEETRPAFIFWRRRITRTLFRLVPANEFALLTISNLADRDAAIEAKAIMEL